MKIKYQKPETLKINVDDLWKIMSKSTTQELSGVLSNDSFLKFRETSEVYNMWLLEKAVDVFESFYNSNWIKTLWKCVEENWVDDFCQVLNICSWQALIRLLSECEDGYLEGITNGDINGFGENHIKLFAPKRGQISTKKMIKEIRDWISHRRYIIWKDWIYIYNSKWLNHKTNFEALIGWKLFADVHAIRKFTQNFSLWEFMYGDFVFRDDDNSDYSIFDESMLNWEELAEIFAPMSKEEDNEMVENSLEDCGWKEEKWNNYNKYNSGWRFVDNIWKIKVKEYKIQKTGGIKLSDFRRNGANLSIEGEDMRLSGEQCNLLDAYFSKHDCDLDGFRFAFWHLENMRPHVIDHLFMNGIINHINFNYKNFQNLPWGVNNENYESFDFLDFIDNVDLTWKSTLDSNDSLPPWRLVSFRFVSHCYELMPTYLKMLYIINSYLNDNINVIMGSWEDMNETTHIRHALAHGHYSLLPWVKDVLLYDPKCDYHWKFDIDKMYEERKEYEKKRKQKLWN